MDEMGEAGPVQEGSGRIVPMRLQKFLARAGAASRRGSENVMTAGRVRVNGEVVRELGSKVDPLRDRVTVDGVEFRIADGPTYLMLNKPAGYVTTMSDPQGRPCVADLVPCGRYPGLFAVGRLDRDTTGLLLFTTDGEAAHQLLHPSHHVSKHYVALVEGRPTAAQLDRLRHGIHLRDGMAQPAEAEVIGPDDALFGAVAPEGARGDVSVVGIRIQEGRKHQVKRMFGAIGHKVLRLHRDEFGPLRLTGVAEGRWRLLTDGEVAAIRRVVGEAREAGAGAGAREGERED
ncbi:MAG: pseudouridine synthase [Atopobiaceae bacterium]|nr:pseudouridine synthase [Atopobiaceae bacterium]